MTDYSRGEINVKVGFVFLMFLWGRGAVCQQVRPTGEVGMPTLMGAAWDIRGLDEGTVGGKICFILFYFEVISFFVEFHNCTILIRLESYLKLISYENF